MPKDLYISSISKLLSNSNKILKKKNKKLRNGMQLIENCLRGFIMKMQEKMFYLLKFFPFDSLPKSTREGCLTFPKQKNKIEK